MSRALRHTDKTIEELRANRLVVAPECSITENPETDDEKKVYCDHAVMIRSRKRCECYAFPKQMWRNGKVCLRATHVKIAADVKDTGKIRAGQQKQKKKSRR